eukprot:CAMPEP_0117698070 /NCGR_PEP_ID=MMETSP0804-20121206/29571_1 /TAXON_ID=1074897 /ORGANISM="Tetraselmis astigmatica, Strain CCMP880" /LENGTH=233 /DNA_ID=CAMNT_0005512373 /DNA_START=688 /DNA_END=1386 /DNA_ORIENTATION=+
MFSTDWAVKRLLKFVLKRNLGRLLKNEVDLEQLSVQLGSGRVELRQVLLNSEALNEQLGLDGWEITSGYVGAICADVPYTSLSTESCTIQAEEVLITVRPRVPNHQGGPTVSQAGDAASASHGYAAQYASSAAESAGAALSSGVQMLAGGDRANPPAALKKQTIRVELPPAGATGAVQPQGAEDVLLLRAGRVNWRDHGSSPGPVGAPAAFPPPPAAAPQQQEQQGVPLVEEA